MAPSAAPSPAGRARLYRTALDLVAARHLDEYEVFETVLDELSSDYIPNGVLGVLGVADLTIRQVAALHQTETASVLGGLRLQPTPAIEPVLGEVMSMLYLTGENPTEATGMARGLGRDESAAEPVMVVLADVSVAMVERISGFAGLPGPQVVAFLRQRTEQMLTTGPWTA